METTPARTRRATHRSPYPREERPHIGRSPQVGRPMIEIIRAHPRSLTPTCRLASPMLPLPKNTPFLDAESVPHARGIRPNDARDVPGNSRPALPVGHVVIALFNPSDIFAAPCRRLVVSVDSATMNRSPGRHWRGDGHLDISDGISALKTKLSLYCTAHRWSQGWTRARRWSSCVWPLASTRPRGPKPSSDPSRHSPWVFA